MADINTEVHNETCPTIAYQMSSVCVPVTVSPFAKAGATSTKCCGKPVITTGRNTCGGVKNGQCVFTVSQKICVEIPVEFGATATVGDAYVDCIKDSADDIYTDCYNYVPESPEKI